MAAQGMRSFEMSEIVDRGLDAVLDDALTLALDDCDAVFLSVDVDVVDPGAAPGTGTPEPGGLTSRQLLTRCDVLPCVCPSPDSTSSRSSPPYDHAEITAYLANRVVLEALSGIAWRPSRRGPASTGRSAARGPLVLH